MTRLYLITGFLGAGKTTLLARMPDLFPGRRTAMIVNEFGEVGVDSALLRRPEIALTEIKNGSIFCSCRLDQFEAALLRLLETYGPELIFVEASGLSDPTAVRRILSAPAFSRISYAGAVCLTDAARFHKVYQAAPVCRMQLAASDLVLINKADLAERGQIDAISAVSRAQKPGRPVHETVYGQIDPAWLAEMEKAQEAPQGGAQEGHIQDLNLQKLTLTLTGFTPATLGAFLQLFAEETYRIKGFLTLGGGFWRVDCVGPLVEVRPFSGEPSETGRLAVLFGHGLHAVKRIRAAAAVFPKCGVQLSTG